MVPPVAIALYTAAMAVLWSEIRAPLPPGSGELVALFVAAHLGLGVAVVRTWALLLPLGLGAVAVLTGLGDPLLVDRVTAGMPLALGLTLAGWAIGVALRPANRLAA